MTQWTQQPMPHPAGLSAGPAPGPWERGISLSGWQVGRQDLALV